MNTWLPACSAARWFVQPPYSRCHPWTMTWMRGIMATATLVTANIWLSPNCMTMRDVDSITSAMAIILLVVVSGHCRRGVSLGPGPSVCGIPF